MARAGWDLILLDALTAALVLAVVVAPDNAIRVVLGLPTLLVFPGYALLAALYPRRQSISGVARTALSLGMSLALVSLLGLALNYTPWGISLGSVLASTSVLIAVLSIVAYMRRAALYPEQRFQPAFAVRLPALGKGRADRLLTGLLVLAVLGAMAMAGYAITQPKPGERFTEFYILGAGAETADYPQQLRLGESAEVTVGVANREYENVAYRLVVAVDGVQTGETRVFTLEHEELWQQVVAFTPQSVGENQQVEFLLYREGAQDPYLGPLLIRIDVSE